MTNSCHFNIFLQPTVLRCADTSICNALLCSFLYRLGYCNAIQRFMTLARNANSRMQDGTIRFHRPLLKCGDAGGERGEGCLAQQLDNGCHTLPCFYIFCIVPKIRGCTLCGLDQGYIGGKEAGWWAPGRAHQPLSTQSHPTIHPPNQRQLLDASIFEMERGGLG